MRTHKELLIATKTFATEDRGRSWWHVCSTMAALGLLLVIVCTNLWWGLRLPFSLVLGLVIVRMFVLSTTIISTEPFCGDRAWLTGQCGPLG